MSDVTTLSESCFSAAGKDKIAIPLNKGCTPVHVGEVQAPCLPWMCLS